RASAAHGSLSGTAPNLTYTPNAGFVGTDSFTFTVTDSYGLASSPATVKITVKDTQPPVTTATLDRAGPDGKAGWSVQPVKVTLNAMDNVGVAATYYTIDGGSQQTYSGPFILSADGSHTVKFWSVDEAGNTENPK